MTSPLPDLWHGIAWAADPGDPQAVPVWTDHSAMVTRIDEIARGRQYELGVSPAAQPTFRFRDPDELLNIANTASAYWPFQQPYRQLANTAVWPKGSTGNLLNLNNWRIPVDGSFESYAVGERPEFIDLAAVVSGPDVTTTNPQQGTKSLTYDIATTTARQGITLNTLCVPGTQYTISAYVRQTSASTQEIRISDQVHVSDTFNRTTAASLGSADAPLNTGGAWQLAGGLASTRSTVPATMSSPGAALVDAAVLSQQYHQTISTGIRDARVRARLSIPTVPTSGVTAYRLMARWTDSVNYYMADLRFSADRTIALHLRRVVAGVETLLTSATLEGVYLQAGDEFSFDFWVTGDLLRAAAWRSSDPVRDIETDAVVTWTDTAITGTGRVGYQVISTGTTMVVSTYAFSAVGSVEGTSTTTTGSYVRLSTTWTATAPYHNITIATRSGTALTGTVNIDAIMLNTGAAAGVFTDVGSSIYPVFRGYLERLPRKWWGGGFNGYAECPAVDALAAMAAIDLPSDYDYQVTRLGADYYWPLSGGANTTSYPDATGNNNPALWLNISKFGDGTPPAGGTSMGIPGGAGATGVTFTPPSPATGSSLAGTVLGTGVLGGNSAAPFVVPHSLTGTSGIWRMTVAMWVRATSNGANHMGFYASKQLSTTAGQAYVPIAVGVDTGSGTQFSNVSSTGTIHTLSSGEGLSGINILDGELHLLIGIVVQDTAGDTIVYRYIDDQLDGVNTATTASLGGALRGQSDSLSVGATDDGTSFLAITNGTISKVAVWNRELNPFETALLLESGRGHTGGTSIARFLRDLEQGGYTGEARATADLLTADSGDPIAYMQAPSWTGGMDLLTQSQNTTTAEQGTMWVAPDGAVTLEGRHVRWQRLTSAWTLGEDTAGGEHPYGSEVEFDYDPTYVFGRVTATRPGGAVATGGTSSDIASATRRFFARRFGVSGDWDTDQQAQNVADWVFNTHRAPLQRVSEIELDPAANASLWPFVLGVEVGMRVTVKRRAKAANGGAGLTMSTDYFVENVTHHSIDFEAGTWKTKLLLSPIGEAPGVTLQPWILGDPTLSVLGSTTVLGF